MESVDCVVCEDFGVSALLDSWVKWAGGPTISQTIGYRTILNPMAKAIIATAAMVVIILGMA